MPGDSKRSISGKMAELRRQKRIRVFIDHEKFFAFSTKKGGLNAEGFMLASDESRKGREKVGNLIF